MFRVADRTRALACGMVYVLYVVGVVIALRMSSAVPADIRSTAPTMSAATSEVPTGSPSSIGAGDVADWMQILTLPASFLGLLVLFIGERRVRLLTGFEFAGITARRVAVCGVGGSGKSTLVECLASGEARAEGRTPQVFNVRVSRSRDVLNVAEHRFIASRSTVFEFIDNPGQRPNALVDVLFSSTEKIHVAIFVLSLYPVEDGDAVGRLPEIAQRSEALTRNLAVHNDILNSAFLERVVNTLTLDKVIVVFNQFDLARLAAPGLSGADIQAQVRTHFHPVLSRIGDITEQVSKKRSPLPPISVEEAFTDARSGVAFTESGAVVSLPSVIRMDSRD